MQHAKRISLLAHMPLVVRNNVVLVQRALCHRRNEALPDAGRVTRLQGMRWESHPLKSPTTETERALGAHTPKYVPDFPSTVVRCDPSLS